jgi:hypothetical protein
MADVSSDFESLKREINFVSLFPLEDIKQLISRLIGFLLQPARSTLFQEYLAELAEKNNALTKHVKPLTRSLLIILQEATKNCWSCTKLEEELTSLEVPQDPKKEIVHIWGQHYQEVSKTLLSQTINTNSLVDVDWSFGVTSASDTCDQIGRTFLQLKLTLDRGDAGHQNVFIELSLENFYSFLGQIEKMKGYLDILAPSSTASTDANAQNEG